MIGYRKSQAYRRDLERNRYAIWAGHFEAAVLRLRPDHAGKIEWSNPQYLHGTGMSYDEAAARYCSHLAPVVPHV